MLTYKLVLMDITFIYSCCTLAQFPWSSSIMSIYVTCVSCKKVIWLVRLNIHVLSSPIKRIFLLSVKWASSLKWYLFCMLLSRICITLIFINSVLALHSFKQSDLCVMKSGVRYEFVDTTIMWDIITYYCYSTACGGLASQFDNLSCHSYFFKSISTNKIAP